VGAFRAKRSASISSGRIPIGGVTMGRERKALADRVQAWSGPLALASTWPIVLKSCDVDIKEIILRRPVMKRGMRVLFSVAVLLIVASGQAFAQSPGDTCDTGNCQYCKYVWYLFTTVCRFAGPSGTGWCYCDDSNGPCITNNVACSVDDPHTTGSMAIPSMREARIVPPRGLPWENAATECSVRGDDWLSTSALR